RRVLFRSHEVSRTAISVDGPATVSARGYRKAGRAFGPPRHAPRRAGNSLLRGVREGLLGIAAPQRAADVLGLAGAASDLAAGSTGNRTRRYQQHIAHGDAVALRDGRAHRVGDRLRISLARARATLGDDDELFGGVVGVELQPGMAALLEHLGGQLVGRNRERGDEAGAQRLARLLRGVLEVLRVVVAAVDDHQVLDAAGDVELAVEVDAVVAGAHPVAVGRGALGVAARLLTLGELVLEGRRGLVRAAPVADAHVVAVQPDLTDPAVGQFVPATVGFDGLRIHDHGPLRQRDITAGHLRDGVGCAGIHLDHATGI